MSATLSSITRPARELGFAWLLLSASYSRITAYFARRVAMAALRELDDRALRDIGIRRSQIEAAVRGFIPRSSQRRT